jgi:ribonuclease G
VIQVHAAPGERRIALLRAGVLTEYAIDRPGAPDGLGDVHLARVLAKMPAMAGAFVALQDAEGFLPDTKGAAGLTEGDLVAVRITRAAQGGKGPRVAACPDAPKAGTSQPGLLRRGPSALDDMRAAYPGEDIVEAPFSDVLETEIDALAAPDAMLEGGLRAIFSPLPALTAIDLDGAQSSAARSPKAAAQMGANRDAIPGLVRQIVLRNLSGAILIDFAGLPTRKRQALAPSLAAALATDRLQPHLAGFSHLGFAELTRPRRRPPLHELIASPHGLGLAALRRAQAELAHSPARRLVLRAAPAIITALRGDDTALDALARHTTYPLVLRVDPALRGQWSIEDDSA